MAKAKHNGHLQLDPRNARKHSPRNQALIRQSLETVGAGRSILADANGIVRAGNGVFEQAQALGIPVKVVESDGKSLIAVKRTDLKGKAAVRAAMLDNLAADSSYADYDAEILASIAKDDELIATLAREDKVISALLNSQEPQAEKVDPSELVDKAAELQKKWKVARGDIWEIGKHRLMCGDSTSKVDVERLMNGKRAQLLLTDPPYGVGYLTRSDVRGRYGESEGQGADAVDDAALAEMLNACFASCDEQLVVHGTVLVFHPDKGGINAVFIAACKAQDWRVMQTLIWVKEAGTLGWADYRFQHEPILLCYKGKRPERLADRTNTTVLKIDREPDYSHPTQKPTELLRRFVRNHTGVNGISLDPFVGSGSTLVACEQTGRIGYGMEIEPKYCAVTLERLANLGLTPRKVEDGKAR